MDVMKKAVLAIALLTLLTGAGCDAARLKLNPPGATSTPRSFQAPTPGKGQIMIYVGEGCPHCIIVESKVKNAMIDKKLPISFKEVFNDQDNAAELLGVAKSCGLPTAQLGVPVLWDGVSCYQGDQDILDYLDKRMKAYANEP
jgi:glutaredoxin